MKLVFLHGPPACGKLTVARALSARTALPVFHNHLIVDAVGALFPFGSPSFIELREVFWLAAFEAAARENRSFIFTFAPERTVRDTFVAEAVRVVEARGGAVRFVALSASPETIEARIEAPSRAQYGKLRSLAFHKQLAAEGAYAVAPLPAELSLDTGALAPEESAARIAEKLNLPNARL